MIYLYDSTYEGLLSTIFEIFRLDAPATDIITQEDYQPGFFDQTLTIETSEVLANRVICGLNKKCGVKVSQLIYRCFLSEKPGIEMLIYHLVKKAMTSKINILEDYRDSKVLELHKINKQIGREVHRMHAFVRFQEAKDGIYICLIEPDFNVLPLIGKHFVDRYPAFEWLIYDTKRQYGIHFKQKLGFVTFPEAKQRHLAQELLSDAETDYQNLWKSYFKAVDIPERRNMKLHIQHLPRRYWKYLVEKWQD